MDTDHITNTSENLTGTASPASAQVAGGNVISKPGAALQVRVVPMNENIRVAIGNALSDGKAQRSLGKKFLSLFFWCQLDRMDAHPSKPKPAEFQAFEIFTKRIMFVPKTEIDRRAAEEKNRRKRRSASSTN